MNVFFAALATESNSFSSIPTAASAFALGQRRGAAVFGDRGMYGEMARGLRELVEAEGGRVSPGLFAFAQPAAPHRPVGSTSGCATRCWTTCGPQCRSTSSCSSLHGAMISAGMLGLRGWRS